MELTSEDNRRSLSDLRSNLETGLYSPASFDPDKKNGGLGQLGGVSSQVEKPQDSAGENPAAANLARRNSVNSSNKIVSGSRLI